jgi:hypothetical protein
MFVKRDEVNIHDELKEFEEISKKEVNAELNTERIRAWILKNFKKVYNIEKSNEELIVGRNTT